MRYVLILIFSWLFYTFLKKKLPFSKKEERWNPFKHARRPQEFKGDMVRDPVCGTFVLKEIALKRKVRDEELFFCSEECEKKYLIDPKKSAE
jgi:YHS domain-containing protein